MDVETCAVIAVNHEYLVIQARSEANFIGSSTVYTAYPTSCSACVGRKGAALIPIKRQVPRLWVRPSESLSLTVARSTPAT